MASQRDYGDCGVQVVFLMELQGNYGDFGRVGRCHFGVGEGIIKIRDSIRIERVVLVIGWLSGD